MTPAAALLATMLLVAIVFAGRSLVDLAKGSGWSLPVVVGIAFVVGELAFLQDGSWQRYLSTAGVLLVAWSVRSKEPVQDGRAARLAVRLLAGYMIIGSAFGRLARGAASGVLPIGLPMLTTTLRPSAVDVDALPIRKALTAMSVMALAYSVAMWLTRSGAVETGSVAFGHEKAFISILGLACAVSSRRPILLVMHVIACVGAFIAYPAATFVMCLAVAVATYVMIWRPPRRATRRFLAAAVVVGGVFALFRIGDFIDYSAQYFEFVGKTNNGDVRRALAELAYQRIAQRPLLSSYFTESVSVRTILSGENADVPFHNDYLTLAVGGGLVAAVGLMVIVLMVNGQALRAVRTGRGREELASVLPAVAPLLAAFNAAMAAAFANPVLLRPQSGAIVWALALALGSVAAAVARGDAGPKAAHGDHLLKRMPYAISARVRRP